jgi:hypothetical protein
MIPARRILIIASALGFLLALMTYAPAGAPSQIISELRRVREIGVGPIAGTDGAGLAYVGPAGRFVVLEERPIPGAGSRACISRFTTQGRRAGGAELLLAVRNPPSVTFDERSGRLLSLDPDKRRLWTVLAGQDGVFDPASVVALDATGLGLEEPVGMASDGEGGVFILDSRPPRVVRASLVGDGAIAVRSERRLDPALGLAFLGFAFHPGNGHLYTAETKTLRLLELTSDGELVSSRNLSPVLRGRPRGLVLAPSGDATDEPSRPSLYVLESTAESPDGRIAELAFDTPITLAAAPTVVATLVRTIHTWQFSPPSPDPDGIAYYPPTGTFFITDGEVEEMSIYDGANIFEMSVAGSLVRGATTIAYSEEPTGIAYNPSDGHLFVSDDIDVGIHDISPGADGIPFTADDGLKFFSTSPMGSSDPEGVAYDSWRGLLFWVDGLNNEVYKAHPGANGVFDGPAPGGDDIITSFDTTALGVLDPEGIVACPDNGHLFIVGYRNAAVAEIDENGNLLRTIDASAAQARMPAGLGYGPASDVPGSMNLYMVARGVDNGVDPYENDGEVYELSFPHLTAGNTPPVVEAGADRFIRLPQIVDLVGSVVDDGLPNPPGTTTTTWLQVGGPGTAAFANATSLTTTVSFSSAGTYVLLLSATDSELTASDAVTVVVESAAGTVPLDIRISAGTDDAEEGPGGSVDGYSSDLELVYDGGDQTVGVRFNGVGVPQGATIGSAFVQFKVDEVSTAPTSLVIRGQAADNAGAFSNTSYNISSRPRTGAATAWSPEAWTTIGQAGAAQRTADLSAVIQEIVRRPGWVSGNSLVLIITGSGERVAESYNGDQAGAPLLHIDYSVVPVSFHDVAVTGLVAPTLVIAGQTSTVTATVFNQGTYAESFEVGLADNLGATIGPPQAVTELEAGTSRILDFEWTPTATGTHILTVTAAAVEGETDTEDNAATASVVVEPVPVHDVAILTVSAPDPAPEGLAQNVSVTVANEGTVAETFEVGIADDLGASVGPPQTVSSLAAGASRTLTFSWTPTEPGTHLLTASAETVGGETETADNVLTTTSLVEFIAIHDIEVAAVTAPSPVIVGLPQIVSVTVANVGTFAESFEVSLADDLGATVGPPQTVAELAAGLSQTLTFAWTPAVTGTHTLTAAASTVSGETDTADNAGTASSLVSLATTSFEVRVSAGADDAEEDAGGLVDMSSSDLELVYDKGIQTIGIRFNGVPIPPGATVGVAYVQFKTDERSADTTSLIVQGEAADNSAPFTRTSFNVSARPRTTAAALWSPPSWIAVGEAGLGQRTPDLANLIQEIVSRPGWASGNSLALIFSGSGERVAESFDGDQAGAPLLHVEYSVAPLFVHDIAVTSISAPTPAIMGELSMVTATIANQGTYVESFEVSLADDLGATVGPPQTVAALAAGASLSLSFAWTPAVTGTHTLTAVAAAVSGETDTADNVKTTTSIVASEAVHDVAVTAVVAPLTATVNVAQNVTVTVANEGMFTESFEVGLAGDLGATVGPPQTVAALAAGGRLSLSFAWTPAVTGTHTLTATASTVNGEIDTADNAGTTSSQVYVATTSFEVRVSSGGDDVEENSGGTVDTSSSDLELIYDKGVQTIGIRFNGVAIPQGATIGRAYVQFKTDERSTDATSLIVQGEATDSSAPFTRTSFNVSTRHRTAATASWSPPSWMTIGEMGLGQRTPDLAQIFQEIVNRPGWASGNSLVLIITGSGERVAESYDGDRDGAPLLHVEYRTAAGESVAEAYELSGRVADSDVASGGR